MFMKYSFGDIALVITISIICISCSIFDKSWDTIYQEQQKFFTDNRKIFESSAYSLNSTNINDTSLLINDKYLQLPDTLVVQLKQLGIARVSIHKYNCPSKDIKFIPDSLWDADRFFILEITYNECDERNRKDYHWKLEQSDHKHSFGQGGGWFIYSDTDFL